MRAFGLIFLASLVCSTRFIPISFGNPIPQGLWINTFSFPSNLGFPREYEFDTPSSLIVPVRWDVHKIFIDWTNKSDDPTRKWHYPTLTNRTDVNGNNRTYLSLTVGWYGPEFDVLIAFNYTFLVKHFIK